MSKDNTQKEQHIKRSDTAFLMQGSLLAAASIISRIVGLVYRIPMTAIIGKRGNDFYGTAFSIYNIMLIISSYSIPLAVSKLVATRVAKKEFKNAFRVLKGSLLFATLTGGTAALVMWFGADYFTGTMLKTPLAVLAVKVLSPVVFIVAILGVFRGFFQGLNTMKPSALSQVIEQIVNAFVSVTAAFVLVDYGSRAGAVLMDREGIRAAYGAAGGTLGTAAGAMTALFVMFVIFLVMGGRFKKRLLRDHSKNKLRYMSLAGLLVITIIPVLLSTTLYNIASIANQGVFKNIAHLQHYDPKLVSEWWGVYAGQFNVLINVPISIASALAASSVPSLTTSFHEGDMPKVKRQIVTATRFIMIIAFPCAVGMAVLGGPIMMLLFSDFDKISGNMMTIGAVAIVFFSLSTLTNGLLQGIDKMRIPVMNAAISLVLQTVVLVFLMMVFHLHIYAVVITNAFYGLSMCFLNGRAVRKYAKTRQNIKRTYLIPLEASVVMGVAVFFAYRLLHTLTRSNAISCLMAIAVGAMVYFVVLVLMRGITEYELKAFPKGEVLVALAKKMHLM